MKELSDILNWRRWNDKITLSGQPTEAQLASIQASGVSHIINLGPHSNQGALTDEASTVAALGMAYVYLPVDFDNPTEIDFATFCDALAGVKEELVHVHCIYNARVTAFFYRYAKTGKGGDVLNAHALMESIWKPGGVWAAFLEEQQSIDQGHQYAGEDY